MCNGRGRNRENGSTLVHIGAEYQKQEGGRREPYGASFFCPLASILREPLLLLTIPTRAYVKKYFRHQSIQQQQDDCDEARGSTQLQVQHMLKV